MLRMKEKFQEIVKKIGFRLVSCKQQKYVPIFQQLYHIFYDFRNIKHISLHFLKWQMAKNVTQFHRSVRLFLDD